MVPAKGELAQPPLFFTLPCLLFALDLIVLSRRRQHCEADRDIAGHVLDPLDLRVLEGTPWAPAEQIGVLQLEHELAGRVIIPFGSAQ